MGAYRLSSQEPHPHPYPCPDPLSPAAPERFILQIWVTAPAVTDDDGDYQNDSAKHTGHSLGRTRPPCTSSTLHGAASALTGAEQPRPLLLLAL